MSGPESLHTLPPSRRLHPLIGAAAVAVVIASLTAVAAITGVLPTGKARIEVESRKTGTGHAAPMDVEIRINGKTVAQGQVPRSAPLAFTANDAFDVGRDSYSPVALDYFDRKPFAFNGKIDRLDVQYTK